MSSSRKPRSCWPRRLLFAGLALVAVFCATGGMLFRAAQTPPAFYTHVIEIDSQLGAAHAQELETHVLEVNQDVRHEDRWQLSLSADELNGWLATTLPEKFPRALPREVEAPRVAIDDNLVQVACKYQSGAGSSVISIGLEPSLLAEPNTVALRIRHVRAGILPIPVRKFLDDIARRALTGGINLRWDEIEGDPVAILKFDPDPKQLNGRRLTLETLDVQPGQITLGGKSEAK